MKSVKSVKPVKTLQSEIEEGKENFKPRANTMQEVDNKILAEFRNAI